MRPSVCGYLGTAAPEPWGIRAARRHFTVVTDPCSGSELSRGGVSGQQAAAHALARAPPSRAPPSCPPGWAQPCTPARAAGPRAVSLRHPPPALRPAAFRSRRHLRCPGRQPQDDGAAPSWSSGSFSPRTVPVDPEPILCRRQALAMGCGSWGGVCIRPPRLRLVPQARARLCLMSGRLTHFKKQGAPCTGTVYFYIFEFWRYLELAS